MPEQILSIGEVLGRLQRAGQLDEAGVERITQHLAVTSNEPHTPWYIKLLMAVGAWFAAICFLVFLGMAELISSKPGPLLAWGFAFIAGAVILHRRTQQVFVAQLALAMSIAGHSMILFGAYQQIERFGAVPVAAAILCAVLYALYEDSGHRFLSCLAVTATLTAWLITANLHHGVHVVILLETIGLGCLFTDRWLSSALRPMAYALAVSIPLTLYLALTSDLEIHTRWWPSKIVMIAGLIWLYQWAAGGKESLRREPIIWAVVVTVMLGIVSTPGILAAIGLAVLGYARRDAVVLSLGLIFMPAFIVAYYYDLNVDLATKSWIMAGSGAVLLAARWYMSRRPWAREAML
ncbi:MAG: DUF4401 domain-containing protein [Acidobacteriota bacterium]